MHPEDSLHAEDIATTADQAWKGRGDLRISIGVGMQRRRESQTDIDINHPEKGIITIGTMRDPMPIKQGLGPEIQGGSLIHQDLDRDKIIADIYTLQDKET